MGRKMDSKKEVKVGDFVQYVDSGELVCDENGSPLRVIAIKLYGVPFTPCVFYSQGSFDYLSNVQVASSLVLELY